MKKLFLSVITPTYNRGDKLHIAFASLVGQTNKNFQWIIVDDGSTDNTKQIVDAFIENADFPIIYKKIKHGGKHFATRAAYGLADGEYSLELDSDDEFYAPTTVDDLYNMVKSTPNKYVCIGGCFINQHDEVFPKIDGEYIDFDRDKYIEYFCDWRRIDMLNAPWLFKTEYAKSVLPPAIDDYLNYYPEAVINVSRVLKCRDFHMRIFNKPIYRYYVYNSDSVSVHTHKTNAGWYYAYGLLDVFHKYNLLEKYPDFTADNVKKLFNANARNKNLLDVWRVTKRFGLKKYFMKYFFKYLVKQMFSVRRVGEQSVITILGIKIKGGKR